MGKKDFSSPEEGLSPGTRPAAASTPRPACCTSPAAICYWFCVSLLAWGVLALIGLYWRPLGSRAASTILLAAGVGCVANWLRNRTFHCGITAPLLLAAGFVFLLSDARVFPVPPRLVWAFVAAGIALAFLLECKYARRQSAG